MPRDPDACDRNGPDAYAVGKSVLTRRRRIRPYTGADGIFCRMSRRCIVAVHFEDRPIDDNSLRNRANCGSSKFPFEIKSTNFCRIGESVFRRAQKKFALEIQCVTMKHNNRVGVERAEYESRTDLQLLKGELRPHRPAGSSADPDRSSSCLAARPV
jgi:hypothetical protein